MADPNESQAGRRKEGGRTAGEAHLAHSTLTHKKEELCNAIPSGKGQLHRIPRSSYDGILQFVIAQPGARTRKNFEIQGSGIRPLQLLVKERLSEMLNSHGIVALYL